MSVNPLLISSPSNPRVKDVVKLRQRRARDASGAMIVEGIRELGCALDNGHPVSTLFFCPERFTGDGEETLVRRCREASAEMCRCTAAVLDKMAYGDQSPAVLAVTPQFRRSLADLRLRDPALLVVAVAIEKPGNLGTILRSADATGADGVIVCDRCTDICNPNVIRASLGTVFSVPVVETDSSELLPWLRERGIRIVATTPHATMLYTQADLTAGCAILLGAEESGLDRSWIEAADPAVRIPMMGQADSLNVSASATVLLYEAVRQRSAATSGAGTVGISTL